MNRVGLFLLCFAFAVIHASAAETKTLYVQVIWGTDQDKPAGSDYREVGPKLKARLSPIFRWKHYWKPSAKRSQQIWRRSPKCRWAINAPLRLSGLSPGK